MTTLSDDVEVRQGTYGEKVIAVEPGGAEFIPLSERHGRPLQLFWTWTSPNMEFATVFVGFIGIVYFGLSFWETFLAVVIGTGVGSITQGLLSTAGPRYGVPQMVISRRGFGYWGNILPAGINAVVAGIGWFAVNSVSGALALNALTHMPEVLCLLIVIALQLTVALLGYNLIHVFERYAFPVLVVIFMIASVWTLAKGHPGAGHKTVPGGFLIEVGATFGYAVGWNPYASDYTRYFKPDASKAAIAWWSGLGVLLSCVLLETAGAAAATLTSVASNANPTAGWTGIFPEWMSDLTLIAIVIGGIAANALNIYSGAISFTALGFKLPLVARRAAVALGFGTIGFFVAWSGLHNAGADYNNFLLIISYWIGPWLAVILIDMILNRRQDPAVAEQLLFNRKYTNWAGPVAMAVGVGISIWLFANQPPRYVGLIPTHDGNFGDLTFEAGIVITTVIYLTWRLIAGRSPARAR